MIQNQYGKHPLKWDKSSTVMEVLPHNQYTLLVDGSRPLTKRNRKYLRLYTPATVSFRNSNPHPYAGLGQSTPPAITTCDNLTPSTEISIDEPASESTLNRDSAPHEDNVDIEIERSPETVHDSSAE